MRYKMFIFVRRLELLDIVLTWSEISLLVSSLLVSGFLNSKKLGSVIMTNPSM